MLHTGYLFGSDAHAPVNSQGALPTLSGATFGIGGSLRVNLLQHLRVGGEGFVSTMSSSLSSAHAQLERGSFVRSGWGGIGADACWRDLPPVGKTQLWPYIGASMGGGATRSLYILSGNQNDWEEEAHSVFHKQGFMYVDPYVGFDCCLTEKVHLTFRLDWQLAFTPRQAQLLYPTGPRLYVGFMFCH